jgi:acetoacetate decarboxylase
MKIKEIQKNAFSMPYSSPSAIKIDYTFRNREYLAINYQTDINILKEIVPEPLKVVNPIVSFRFVKMPDASGFGSYNTVSQLVEVEYKGKMGLYCHSMYLDNLAPIAAGREIWGFPEKYGKPNLVVDTDTVLGTLKYNSVDIAIGTMGYKYQALDAKKIKKQFETTPNYLLKIIPDVSMNKACLCQLVKFYYKDVKIIGAWAGPAALELFEHALAPVKNLPIIKVVSAQHVTTDLTLGFGEIVYDYLQD